MAELERAAHFREGHIFDGATVRRDLWQLLRIYLSERPFTELTQHELYRDGWDQPLIGLDSEFSEYEVTRILLNTAVSLRVIDDRDGGVLERFDACGELVPEIGGADTQQLSLREACNKILHAERINYDVDRLDGGDVREAGLWPMFLNPTIYLYGTLRGRPWKATLDVMAFVRGGAGAVPG